MNDALNKNAESNKKNLIDYTEKYTEHKRKNETSKKDEEKKKMELENEVDGLRN